MLLYETSVLMYEMELAVATYCKSKAQPLTTIFLHEMSGWWQKIANCQTTC